MSALFPRWTNTAYRLGWVALVGSPLLSLLGLWIYMRTPWNTEQDVGVDQPVEFDHRHHVIDDGIDCLYCHRNAEISDFAGVPSTELCMGCHAQIWNESALLETVRRSYFSGKPIPWNRVHDLPDFVYFSHAVHVQGGVGCVQCHGRVDEMARVQKVHSLHMSWCLDCHQHAGEQMAGITGSSPSVQISAAALDQPALWGRFPAGLTDTASLGPKKVDALTTCTACHR